ncbi:WbqC family protein [Mucilaginibacter lappiensis]|uniref:WbqC-like protein family protein n=1 Tax=Mucilaginibacter lappiensis TaxID=354630 RepID=A0A841JPS8_9SPHI|nr:WbqC family protein [Mucilaginibacter lappiensis]MBB6130768.1 hypothetical protein [Mucilaginibacter lappiensis]
MKIAIMQPYFVPYIGYFQLVKAVDKFVFYDDVNFIKGGWINRNRILIHERPAYLNIPMEKASSNKQIIEISVNYDSKEFRNILKTIEINYKKAPHFEAVFDLLVGVFKKPYTSVADLAIESVLMIAGYLNIKTTFLRSSLSFPHTKSFNQTERLITIIKELDGMVYINPIGGQELYAKSNFDKKDIELQFIKSENIIYKQGGKEFVPWLSIIDVMMFNSVEQINQMLDQYELI